MIFPPFVLLFISYSLTYAPARNYLSSPVHSLSLLSFIKHGMISVSDITNAIQSANGVAHAIPDISIV